MLQMLFASQMMVLFQQIARLNRIRYGRKKVSRQILAHMNVKKDRMDKNRNERKKSSFFDKITSPRIHGATILL